MNHIVLPDHEEHRQPGSLQQRQRRPLPSRQARRRRQELPPPRGVEPADGVEQMRSTRILPLRARPQRPRAQALPRHPSRVRRLDRPHLVRQGSADRAGQHQRPQSVREEPQEGRRRAPSHGVRDDGELLYAQVIEQGVQIERERAPARPPLHVVAASEGTVVEGDHAIVPRELRHLLPRDQLITAGAVRQDQRRALAVLLVVQVDLVNAQVRHAASRYQLRRLEGAGRGRGARHERGPSPLRQAPFDSPRSLRTGFDSLRRASPFDSLGSARTLHPLTPSPSEPMERGIGGKGGEGASTGPSAGPLDCAQDRLRLAQESLPLRLAWLGQDTSPPNPLSI